MVIKTLIGIVLLFTTLIAGYFLYVARKNAKLTRFQEQLAGTDKNERIYALKKLIENGQYGHDIVASYFNSIVEAKYIINVFGNNQYGNLHPSPNFHLNKAIEKDYTVAVQLLLDNGIDVNGGVRYKPLYEAARLGRYAVTKILLRNGADVNAREGYSRYTPLIARNNPKEHLTTLDFSRSEEMTKLLRDYGGKSGSELAEAK
jgi:hypothetical protein